jgi:hypothetical protein
MTDDDFIDSGEKYLEHFGKRGMRWGHRTGSSNSSSGKASKAPPEVLKKVGKKYVSAVKKDSKTGRGKSLALYGLGVVGYLAFRVAVRTAFPSPGMTSYTEINPERIV